MEPVKLSVLTALETPVAVPPDARQAPNLTFPPDRNEPATLTHNPNRAHGVFPGYRSPSADSGSEPIENATRFIASH